MPLLLARSHFQSIFKISVIDLSLLHIRGSIIHHTIFLIAILLWRTFDSTHPSFLPFLSHFYFFCYAWHKFQQGARLWLSPLSFLPSCEGCIRLFLTIWLIIWRIWAWRRIYINIEIWILIMIMKFRKILNNNIFHLQTAKWSYFHHLQCSHNKPLLLHHSLPSNSPHSLWSVSSSLTKLALVFLSPHFTLIHILLLLPLVHIPY